MITFNKNTKQHKTPTPVADMWIELRQVKQIRVGVYSNTHLDGKGPVGDVIIKYKDDTTRNLKADLSKWQNIFYKLPSQYQGLNPWYDSAFAKAKAWGKKHGANLHCKPGLRCDIGEGERYHTMPCILMSYDPAMKMAFLQIATPAVQANDTQVTFNEYTELEIELVREGKQTLIYDWTGEQDDS